MTAEVSSTTTGRTPSSVRPTAAPLLQTEGLTVRFGGLTALDNVDFAVAPNELRAVIGPNGAGKSTFFNCLTGVQRPSAGQIRFDGEDVTGLSPDRVSQKGIARSYQITNILPNATTLENVRIAAQSRRHGWSLLSHHRAFATSSTRPRRRSTRWVCSSRPTCSPPTCRMASSAISRSR